MKNLSKSRYTAFCQCSKNLWLKVYKPDQATIDSGAEARFEQGNSVGDLAMGLLGEYTEVTTYSEDGKLDLKSMIEKTHKCLTEGVENICEASFAIKGNYCAVDILHKTSGGFAIYEVKSSSFPEFNGKKAQLDKYVPDIAYQKWVLEQCGVNVTGTYLVCLNSDYRLDGDLDLKQLFVIIDMAEQIQNEYDKVPSKVAIAQKMLQNTEEPDIDLGLYCKKPYDCAFFAYCMKEHGVPLPAKIGDQAYISSVFELNGTSFHFDKKLDFYKRGIITADDMKAHVEEFDARSQNQILAIPDNNGPVTPRINKEGIREFLSTLSYPLYFLDFETMQMAVPEYQGIKPYQQIPFQYSLHYIEEEGGELRHKEYLAQSDGSDPRRGLAEQLCKDIPLGVCTTAYNKAFECARIKEMAETYPDLALHLIDIRDHIKDFLDPFRAWYYYLPAMRGSFSIKSVLPALCPNDPYLDYHQLPVVHNGGEAMTIFPKIKDMEPEEQKRVRDGLLQYCGLDTLAMVKVWERLKEAIR